MIMQRAVRLFGEAICCCIIGRLTEIIKSNKYIINVTDYLFDFH